MGGHTFVVGMAARVGFALRLILALGHEHEARLILVADEIRRLREGIVIVRSRV